MPNPMIAVAGISAGTGLAQSSAQKKAAKQAADAQTEASRLSIEEQRRQFDQTKMLLQPFVDMADPALAGIGGLLGFNGAEAQQAELDMIANSPELAYMVGEGEKGILGNAAATGGLRGGDTQRALAELRPGMFNTLLQQRYGRLMDQANLGQNAAAGVGNAGQHSADMISGAYGDIGAARAGQALAVGQANSNLYGGIAGMAGNILGGIQPPAGAGLFSKWGF